MKVKGGKQFMKLCGKPALQWTLEKYEDTAAVSDIVLVVAPAKLKIARVMVRRAGIKKVRKIVPGGRLRQDSVANALSAIDFPCDIVLVHDGARPFVSEKEINRVVRGAQKYGACLAATPVKDTLKIVKDGRVVSSPDRRHYWAAQTPQGFKFKLLKTAYARAAKSNIEVTDDAMLVEGMGHSVHVVQGSCYNLKITTPEDRVYAEGVILNEKRKRRGNK
jgi:2-C-methyl-D-erythritol 4-phosphate cytidylyltransferase